VSPTVILVLAWTGLVLAAIPALLTRANLRLFVPPPEPPADAAAPKVSVLVPARNEAEAISRLIDDVLASRGVELELVILDDSSSDATTSIVAARAEEDPRVRLVAGRPLPAGWCGKQHACWQLAEAARHDLWVFLDVDVSPAPDAIRRGIAFLEASGADLASGFPRQETGSLLEWLLLPLINFVLLGYLPIARSREVNSPSLAAGCGQFFITRRAAYEQAGGHAAIRASLHDGVKLPRAYRRAGLVTDIFDATPIASCRMYDRSIDVWRGLSKNATEGVGSAATILPFTVRRWARGDHRRGGRLPAPPARRDPVPAEPLECRLPAAGSRGLPGDPVDRLGPQGPRFPDDLARPQPRPAVSPQEPPTPREPVFRVSTGARVLTQ